MSTANKLLTGRTKIISSCDTIDVSNIEEEIQTAYLTHVINKDNISYLWDYYKGTQPILGKIKLVRPEINNRVVENHALEIVEFKKGYVFGEQVQYVRKGKDEQVSDIINLLNDLMIDQEKFAQDDELAEWMYVCGLGFRLALPTEEGNTESPFYIKTLDPRYTFVVYENDIRQEPKIGVTYTVGDNGLPKTFYCYTKTAYFEIQLQSNIGDNASSVTSENLILNRIPIIEYPANNRRMGAFEPVIPLLNALNDVVSNRMDGVEQFVQSFMKFVNCDIDVTTFQSFKDLGAIKIQTIDANMPSDVDIISSELSQGQTQLLKEDLYQTVLIICGMPDRKTTKSGGDTGQAVLLRDGWGMAESRAKTTELIFKKSERQLLKVILKILELDTIFNSNLKLSEIDIKFTRNKSESIMVKTQALQGLLTAGINPQIAIRCIELFSDPEQVFVDSEKYLKKWELERPPEEITTTNDVDPTKPDEA